MQTHIMAMGLGNTASMDDEEVEAVLLSVARRNPALLVGGYDVDIVIIAAYVVLIRETDPASGYSIVDYDGRIDRICEMLEVLYAGLI